MPPIGPAAQIEVALAQVRVMLRAHTAASEALMASRGDQRAWRSELAPMRVELMRMVREMQEALAELTPLPNRVSDAGAAFKSSSEYPAVRPK